MLADSEARPASWLCVRRNERILYRLQLFQHAAQFGGLQRIRPVGLGVHRVLVDFHEDSIDARRHGGPRQHRDKLGLSSATACSPSAAEDGSCTECVASKTTGTNLRMMASERMSTTRLL